MVFGHVGVVGAALVVPALVSNNARMAGDDDWIWPVFDCFTTLSRQVRSIRELTRLV